MKHASRIAAIVTLVAATMIPFGGHSQARSELVPGVTSTQILVGDSLPQSGPAAAYAVVAGGEQAYFSYVNAHGGVFGRKLNLIVLDDGYDPARQLINVKNLVLNKGVFALL